MKTINICMKLLSAQQIGNKRIAMLKKSDIKRFYNYIADERGLKASTIDSIHTVLHQILDMAVDDDYNQE